MAIWIEITIMHPGKKAGKAFREKKKSPTDWGSAILYISIENGLK